MRLVIETDQEIKQLNIVFSSNKANVGITPTSPSNPTNAARSVSFDATSALGGSSKTKSTQPGFELPPIEDRKPEVDPSFGGMDF